MTDEIQEAILKALRRITRAIDVHSRQLANAFGLTGPQLVCLRVVAQEPEMTLGKLAQAVSLSQATVTGIVERLVTRQLLVRRRSRKDRRVVTVRVTDAGRELVRVAPSPLQQSFLERLAREPREAQERIRDTLETIVRMMDGERLVAAPVLSTSPAALSAEEIAEAPEGETPDLVPLALTPDETPAVAETPLEPAK